MKRNQSEKVISDWPIWRTLCIARLVPVKLGISEAKEENLNNVRMRLYSIQIRTAIFNAINLYYGRNDAFLSSDHFFISSSLLFLFHFANEPNDWATKFRFSIHKNLNGLIKAICYAPHSISFELFLFLCYWCLCACVPSICYLCYATLKIKKKGEEEDEERKEKRKKNTISSSQDSRLVLCIQFVSFLCERACASERSCIRSSQRIHLLLLLHLHCSGYRLLFLFAHTSTHSHTKTTVNGDTSHSWMVL